MSKENKSNFGTFRNSFEFRIQRKIRDRKTLVHAIHVYAHGVEAATTGNEIPLPPRW